jgi:antitoxin component YwqK of YwqJK toxin-antitoxin module
MRSLFCFCAVFLLSKCSPPVKSETRVENYPSGKKQSEAFYMNDQKDGKETVWDTTGKIMNESYYTKGHLDSSIDYQDATSKSAKVVMKYYDDYRIRDFYKRDSSFDRDYYYDKPRPDTIGSIGLVYKKGVLTEKYINYLTSQSVIKYNGKDSTVMNTPYGADGTYEIKLK